jgi:mycoredoxin
MTQTDPPTSEQQIIAYMHNACPMWPPVKGMLERTGVHYVSINIHEDIDARERVRDINNGYESVPTLVFPDGDTLTEPGTGELRNALEARGYRVPLSAILIGNAFWIVIGLGFVLALLRGFGII